MFVLTGLLYSEYRFFKRQTEEFLLLKEDYQNYIGALKEQLDMFEQVRNSDEFQKKKFRYLNKDYYFPDDVLIYSTNELNQPDPIFVNRSQDYLKDSAIEFGKQHRLHDAVAKLYLFGHLIQEAFASKKPNIIIKKQKEKPLASGTIYSRDFPIQWPLDRSKFWISSTFGPRKKPDGSWGFHHGLDMAALKGTPVHAIAAGTILEATYSNKGYGNCIVVTHNKKYKSRYAHLDVLFVRTGQSVSKGQLIGRVGDTGSVRGKNASHLHLEVMIFGKKVNPLYILS